MTTTKSHDMTILHSSEESDWRTPPECFQALDEEFHFGLDAAADRESRLCTNYLGPDHVEPPYHNALAIEWHEVVRFWSREVGQTIFLNPPFSRKKAAAYRTGRIQLRLGQTPIPHPKDRELAKVYEIESWAEKCWKESQAGCTIVALMPFAPQTEWYREYVYGHTEDFRGWSGHAAAEERRLPHRISFLRPDGSESNNAGVNTAIIVWKPMRRTVGPWQPHQTYWSYR